MSQNVINICTYLTAIPNRWDVLRFKNAYTEINEKSTDGSEDLLSVSEYYGVAPRRSKISQGESLSRADSLEGYKKCLKGDLVMNIMLAWKCGLGVSKYEGIVSPAYCVFRHKQNVSPPFMHYLLRTDEYTSYFKAFSSGVIDSRLRLYPEQFGQLYFGCPPMLEQRQIAAYLNRETAKIDKLIAKQQKLIKLLQEKRQALISQAVTKGLDPNVKMTESGIAWLGMVPNHWARLSIRHMTQILRGKFTHRPRNDPTFYDGDYPFIQTGDITRADKYITSYKQTLNERGAAVSRQFPSGTLVMAIAANIGDVGIINFDAYFPDSIVGLVPRDRTNLDFLFYLMQALKPSLLQNATVSTQMNLNADQIARIIVVCPPIDEQMKIVDFIETNLTLFNTLSDKAHNALDLLKEHRQALITAAVTGKIDVRNLVSEEEVAALGAEPEVEIETTEADYSSEVFEDTYITEEE